MDTNEQNQLEVSLTGLSWWSGPAPGLWKKALSLSQASTKTKPARLTRILRSPWPWVGVPIAAVIVAAILPTSQMRREQARNTFPAPYIAARSALSLAEPAENDKPDLANREVHYAGKAITESSPTLTVTQQFTGRQVVRKASIDLKTDDVRGLYLKVLKITPNEAVGEYVEQTQIYDHENAPTAYLTLRVRSERLAEVLNTLRGMAEVLREETNASDITSQVVDLEARLRNERRIEQELLDLLEKRKGSPLQDLLKLSESLSAVRERIEILVAQQQQMQHQVALATVVVSIQRTAQQTKIDGFAAQLKNKLSSAWSDGGYYLISSVAMLVRVLIGGLIWWIILCLGLWLLHRWYLKRADSTT